MSIASHHQHMRKRKIDSEHPFPTKDSKIRMLDNLVAILSFVLPLSALPQIYNIWVLKNVQGVSFLTWLLFLIMQFPFFIYAIVHKENRLKILFGLWCVVYVIILLGLIVYQ